MTALRRTIAGLIGIGLVAMVMFGYFAPARAAEPLEDETKSDIRALIATLKDEGERDKLIADLEALLAVNETARKEVERDSLMGRAASALARIGHEFQRLVRSIGGWRDMIGWLSQQVGDADRRVAWGAAIGQVILVLALASVAGRMIYLAFRSTRRALDARVAEVLLLGPVILLGRAIVGSLPTAGFATLAYATLAVVEPRPETRIVALALVNAAILVQVIVALSTVLLAPLASGPRPIPVSDETAAYLHVWVRRLARVAAYGGFAAQAALLLGVPPVAAGFVLRVIWLVFVGLLIVFVGQNKTAVADFLRMRHDQTESGLLRNMLGRVADVWHLFAIAALAVGFVAWAIEAEGTLDVLIRGVAGTAIAVALARLVIAIGNRLMDRAFAVGVDVAGAMPGVEIRANRYLPILRRVLGFVVLFLAVVAVSEAWGLNALAWLASDWSRDVFSRLFAIGAIVLVALLVIEAIGGVIRRFLDARDARGNVVMRSARMRTLLPLLKNCVVVIVTAIAAFTALSELGVDIGPLLAGAGVVGLAVGFGAQTLVKDVITGAFILFENQIAIGDVVDLGGTSGVVEGMTIRTVTLRDGAGSVITIPFGDVVRVTNMTRDFAFAVLDVNVDYREDPERVSEVLREVDKAMRADPAVARLVLAPIEVMGVSSLGESGVAIRARVMTQAGQQWEIQRRYLGAIKKRFDEAGIRIPFPQRTIHVKHEGLAAGEGSNSAAVAAAARDIG